VLRSRLSPLLPFSVAGLVALAADDARAQEVGPSREEISSGLHRRPIDKEQGDNPFRGSALVFEQSMTTQTTQLQPGPEQSYAPLYELWLSFRPRYYFNEHWSMRGRFDYTKELTNNQPTTYYREDVFGDIWTDLVYGAKLDELWPGTRVSIGPRALLPTSKVSQGNGTYVTLGGTAGALHRFEIHGDGAPALNEFHAGVSVTYLHPFTKATTPTSYGNFAYARQDVGDDDHSIMSDQLQGQTLVNHNLWLVFDTGLQITPRLSVTVDAVFINQWHYQPTGTGVVIGTGAVDPTRVDDHQYTQNVWLLGGVDYMLFDEVDLTLGYYNLANEIAPDGQRRGLFGSDNVWWSPDARLFFDVTANLDVLFDDAAHHRYSRPAASTGEARPARHLAQLGE
jgi:hypothetical protein